MKLFRNINSVIAAVVALALVVAVVMVLLPGGETKRLVADFPRTISVYEGSEVKVLGVAVGTVDKVTPMGTKVRVEMNYDGAQKIPADAKAVVISPSIVGDRFVQLTPVYTGGAVMADNARLGVDRTATPLELDQIFGSLNQLNIALGPEGANKDGSLSRLLDSTARNFGGQGAQFNQTLKDLGKFTATLANNKDELFSSTAELQKFVSTLSKNDDTVRRFNDSLASGADLLADDRQELAAALRNLSQAMTQVRSFVKENRGSLSRNINGLTRVSNTLVKRRAELDETLRVAPLALNNLALAYNPKTGTLDTRDNIGEVFNQLKTNPTVVLCSLLNEATTPLKNCPLDILKGLPGLGRTAPFSQQPGGKPAARAQVDRTLAGLVSREGER